MVIRFLGTLGGGERPQQLFDGPRIESFLSARLDAMKQEVAQLPEEHVRSLDDGAYCAAIGERYGVVLPDLKVGEIWQDDLGETQVDVTNNASYFTRPGQAATVAGRRIALHLPFSGTREVFAHDPPGSCGPKPVGIESEGTLVHHVEYPGTAVPDLKAIANRFANDVQTWLNIGKEAVAEHNRTVVNTAKQLLTERRERAKAAQAALAQSGLPGRPAAQGKRPIVEVIVRRPAPRIPAGAGRIELAPALLDATYEHIIEVLRMAGRGMEQSPGAYAALDEEARRQHLRGTLNTHYSGQATAEAFNHSGKTDILIQTEGKALLVAECKFWQGQKGFSDTIDQLFRYVTWRDTKLAIVMFVVEKGLTEILTKAAAALKDHTQTVALKETGQATELRAEMKWPGDDARRSTLHCLFIHTPKV